MAAPKKEFPLDALRTDGWFERIGEGIGSFQALCEIVGERFFAFSIIVGARITAIGDSIMLGSSGALQSVLGNLSIDAAVGRQVSEALNVLRAKRAAGQLGDVILIHIGTNGTFTAAQFDEMMSLAGGRRVVFVNIKAPRNWQDPNNALLASKVRQYPNARLIDWYSTSINRPDFFAGDGIHPSLAGRNAYANLIASRLAGP